MSNDYRIMNKTTLIKNMKTKFFTILFLTVSINANLIFAQFTQQGPKLVGSGAVGNGQQGHAVYISSDGATALVGGTFDNTLTGAVWVYVQNGGVWTQQGSKLIGSGGPTSYFGTSVSLSADGNTALIGAPGENNHIGAVYVFTRTAGVWTQQGPRLIGTGNTGNSNQGSSVSLSVDGNTALIGGCNDNNLTGAIWVFTRSGGVWTQQGSKLVGSGYVGSSYQGFSLSLSADGNTAIVGGELDNNSIGANWVFTRTGGVWSQVGSKLIGAYGAGSSQGYSVAISSDGNTFVSGGPDDAGSRGAVWVFVNNAGAWIQQGQKLFGSGGNGYYGGQGSSVSISSDGNTIISGGPTDSATGAVWVFTRNGGVWSQLGTKLVGSGYSGVSFQGISVSLSSNGGTFISGGSYDNGQMGAAWIFTDPTIGITPISSEVPKGFQLMQNYPNPFNPSTKIKFQIAKTGDTKIIVYDILGKEVVTLVSQQLAPGTYEVDFDGSALSSGVYFYVLKTESFTATKKLMLIK